MKRIVALGLLLAFAVASGTAQEKKPEMSITSTTVTLKGYIVDQMCAKGMLKKDNPMLKAASHSKECALEDACAASGYGLFSDGKWYAFDEAGSKLARGMIEKDKREKGLSYEVSGKVDANRFAVASLKETTLDLKAGKKKD